MTSPGRGRGKAVSPPLISLQVQRKPKWRLEVLSKEPSIPRRAPPILFVHGAWHAAWCWDEHFLGYFAANGYAGHAVSLRGHGASEGRRGLRLHRIRHYVDDVTAVAATLPTAPIVVGHSMGGFVIQKYLEKHPSPAAFLLASIPPAGARPIFRRLIHDRPLDVLKGNATLSLYALVSQPAKAGELLFPASMPPEQVGLFHRRLQDELVMSWLDCLALDLVDVSRIASPVAVYGAADDAIVGFTDVMAAAKAYKVRPFVFENVAHDMMLDPRWRSVADAIIVELEARFPQTGPEGSAVEAAA